MFTIEQIRNAHSKVKSGADFPQYVQDMKELGVTHYDIFVADGKATYNGANGQVITSGPKYAEISVNSIGSAEKLRNAISIHQQGQTDYPTFCSQAAEAGVEKWTTHMLEMKVTYLDKKGKVLIVEPIPAPK